MKQLNELSRHKSSKASSVLTPATTTTIQTSMKPAGNLTTTTATVNASSSNKNTNNNANASAATLNLNTTTTYTAKLTHANSSSIPNTTSSSSPSAENAAVNTTTNGKKHFSLFALPPNCSHYYWLNEQADDN